MLFPGATTPFGLVAINLEPETGCFLILIPVNEAFKNEDRDLPKGGRPPFNRLMLSIFVAVLN